MRSSPVYGKRLTPSAEFDYADGLPFSRTMHATALLLRHAADALRIDAAVRACVARAGRLSRRGLAASPSSLLLDLPTGCRA
ncbi:hypothetical protein D3C87_1253220 [compost metagenome]|uniref:Uncharacterized protein n=1 Tax=Cupriavidus campinensis TaxID=151783 RepID=A0ABY3EI72_9BURK|nr:hypothetical protein FGG12_22500 [Cupriavidus campinensis]